MWQTIDTAPPNTELLLFCPNRHVTNKERIEIGAAWSDRPNAGWRHAWATHWAHLPTGPDPDEVERILADEAERDYSEREMDQLSHDGQL